MLKDMSQITVDNFIDGVLSICSEKPKYKTGHDGSTGYCDNTGLLRGGLLRSGATKIKNMKEPNQCARFTLLDIHKIDTLKKGDVVLKTRETDDYRMPLIAKYRFGGSDYNGDLTNYCDIGVVITDNPLCIIHMTQNGIKKDKRIGDWEYCGWLPYVKEEGHREVMSNATIISDNAVRVYAKPSFGCEEYFELNDGDSVMLEDKQDTWSKVSVDGNEGYVLTKYVKESKVKKSEIALDDIHKLEEAYAVIGDFLEKIHQASPKQQNQKKRFSFLRKRK